MPCLYRDFEELLMAGKPPVYFARIIEQGII